MRLRHQTFYTFRELNLRIRELMNEMNQRIMKQVGVSRKALFESLDRPALRLLPAYRFEYTTITLNIRNIITPFRISWWVSMSFWKQEHGW